MILSVIGLGSVVGALGLLQNRDHSEILDSATVSNLVAAAEQSCGSEIREPVRVLAVEPEEIQRRLDRGSQQGETEFLALLSTLGLGVSTSVAEVPAPLGIAIDGEILVQRELPQPVANRTIIHELVHLWHIGKGIDRSDIDAGLEPDRYLATVAFEEGLAEQCSNRYVADAWDQSDIAAFGDGEKKSSSSSDGRIRLWPPGGAHGHMDWARRMCPDWTPEIWTS